jgi:hypothetical protein
MDSETIKSLFRKGEILENLEYDPKLVAKDANLEQLAAVINTSYEIGKGAYDDGYQELINEAIRVSNKSAVEMLWLGIYYHDRDNPDFASNLLLAASDSNLETFKFVLLAYQTWATLNGNERIPILDLIAAAKNNPDSEVLEFINNLTVPVYKLVRLMENKSTLNENERIPVLELIADNKNNPDPGVLEFINNLNMPVYELVRRPENKSTLEEVTVFEIETI